ncbi:MAG: pyridoxamine 5'-phosphate oxidase [Bacteroidales bacterium]|nr:pyridoxamine 5'-phosphate oxidase [Bacteroidales bacterium]
MEELILSRREYQTPPLNLSDLNPNPIEQFNDWFRQALSEEKTEANAMAFATVGENGQPSVRYLLLKSVDHNGFIFFTNYESRKGNEINNTPLAALVFYWPVTQRQVRAEGEVEILSPADSDYYFNHRPQGSKIGAWASPQSKPIPNREYLEKLKDDYEKKYRNFLVPRPQYWGGYKLIPNMVEFWQGQPDRLHDRFEYRLKHGVWKKERLAP